MIVSFEGIDGSGKSTVINKVSEALSNLGIPHITTAEPYAYRDFIFNGEKRYPLEELALWCADRNKHINEVIKPLCITNPETIILCDRYIHSTIAYQHVASGYPIEAIAKVADFFTESLFDPNKIYYLDVDIDKAMKRVVKENHYDNKSKEWFYNLQSAYGFALMYEPNVEYIDANKDLDTVVKEVLTDLTLFLKQHK